MPARESNVVRLPHLPSLSADDCRLLVESITDYAIFMLDPEGRVATWNPGAEKIKGYAAGEIIGQHFSKFYLPEDIAAGKPLRELEIAREVGRVEDEGWRVRKDGSRLWANIVITALRDESGHLRGFGKVTRDLTARRAAEEQLRQSEQRFHHLVDAVVDYAIFMLDSTGHVTTWNPGAQRLKGYSTQEIVGRHFSTFYTPEDRASGKPQRILDSVRRDGRFEDEGWRVRKDGKRFWANVVITALRDNRGSLIGFAKVTRDLTVRREAEETERRLIREQAARMAAEDAELRLRDSEARYRELAQRLEEASRTKDQFLATVSHELRTPLTAILGWAKLLRDRAADPTVAKPIEVIYRNAAAQVKIIDDILDVARVITGKFRLEMKPCDIVAIARDAIEVIRPTAVAKKLDIALAPDPDALFIVGDTERLQQVIWNLLSNAVKFSDTGAKIMIALRREGSTVVLSVADTGKGIDPSFIPFVFDRFRQADASITRRVGGLGLGLSIVRHIVELHGGRVAVASQGLGTGATFTITLPIAAMSSTQSDSSLPSRPNGQNTVEARPLGGVRVLIVDDDADARDLVRIVLANAGANVETARSAAEGFAAVQHFAPHVLISDIGMPEEDGYSLMQRIRSLPADCGGKVPSLALTAFASEDDRSRALGAGYTAHLGKPADPEVLTSAVANLAAVRPAG